MKKELQGSIIAKPTKAFNLIVDDSDLYTSDKESRIWDYHNEHCWKRDYCYGSEGGLLSEGAKLTEGSTWKLIHKESYITWISGEYPFPIPTNDRDILLMMNRVGSIIAATGRNGQWIFIDNVTNRTVILTELESNTFYAYIPFKGINQI